jgi:hypothetical protein
MLVFLLFCSLPLLTCSFLVYRWRGGWRLAAAVPLVVVIPVLVTEINSGLHGGNLTGILTIFTAPPILLYVLVLAILNSAAQRPQRSQGPVVTYITAAVSFLFVLGGILFVWYCILLLPFAIQLNLVGMVVYWIVGSGIALSAAVYSFRAAVKPLRVTCEPLDSTLEVGKLEVHGQSD